MRLRKTVAVSARSLAAVLVLGAIAAPAWAQAPPTIRAITHLRVKPDKMGDWVAAEKDYAALVKKAGSDRSFTLWQAMTGPREFIMVRYYSKWAELDRFNDPKMAEHAGALAGIMARIDASVESSWREIHSMQPDLTLPRPAEMPKMIRTARINVANGKWDEVLGTLKTVTLPAMKAAGVTAYGVGRVRYGGGANQIMTHTGFDSWADLDGPTAIEKSAGRDAYLKYVAKMGTLTTRTEWTIYRYRPELSYIADAK
jgi:quinol monooxygenase YgiN